MLSRFLIGVSVLEKQFSHFIVGVCIEERDRDRKHHRNFAHSQQIGLVDA
ncbi:hypothetical protein [Comamonas sp. GB3 AK4-5]